MTSLASIGEGNGNPLQYSCLENLRDGGAWWAVVYGVAQSRTRLKQLSSSSSNDIWCWTSFYVYLPPVYLLWCGMFRSFAQFLIGCLFSYCWLLRIFGIFEYKSFIRYALYKYILLICYLSFILLVLFTGQKFLTLTKPNLSFYFFHGLCFWHCIWKVITIFRII